MVKPVYPLGPIQRVNDDVFIVHTADNKTLQFKITSRKASSETKYHLVEKALKKLQESSFAASPEKLKTTRFRYGEEKWKFSKGHRFTFLYKLLAFLFPFFHRSPKDGLIRINIDSAIIGPKKKKGKDLKAVKAKKIVKDEQKKLLGGKLDAKNFRVLNKEITVQGLTPISMDEYRQGVRSKIPLNEFDVKGDEPAYSDPFTKLATLDFQRYEKYYIAHDNHDPSTCDYRLVMVGKELQLIHKASPLATQDGMLGAADLFLEFATKMYGAEKVDYIDHNYKLGLKSIRELTPEHVYRFNIGTTNHEIQDISQEKPPGGLQRLRALYEATEAIDPVRPLDEHSYGYLTINELRLLKNTLKISEGPVLVQHFRDWMEPLMGLPLDCAAWSPQDFNKLLKVYANSAVDNKRAFSGREIHNVLGSAYTTAEINEFKPWVDQQELTQVFEELKSATSWTSYQEKLSHIVVKKHLARAHPTENYRVGALIPAPPEKPGMPVRWYKVSNLVTNGYIYGYSLESACNDPSLPAIKLYRSTASSPYALYSLSGVMNDLNFLNSPGYLGVRSLDPYDKPFFDNRSIPVWVGYQYAANNVLKSKPNQIEEEKKLLEMGNIKLLENYARENRAKTMREVLEENNATLKRLSDSYGLLAKDVSKDKKKLKDKSAPLSALVDELGKRYMAPAAEDEPADQAQVKKDAADLDRQLQWILKHLDKLTKNVVDPAEAKLQQQQIKEMILKLRAELNLNILDHKPRVLDPEEKHLFGKLRQYREGVNAAIEAKDEDKAKALLNAWKQMLAQESIDIKNADNAKGPSDQIAEAKKLLEMSNKKLLDHYAREHRVKTMREVLRTNDAILNELFLSYDLLAKAVSKDKKQIKDKSKPFTGLLDKLVNRYIAPPTEEANKVDPAKVKKDAAHLELQMALILKHLDKLTEDVADPTEVKSRQQQIRKLIVELRADLKANVLDPQPRVLSSKEKQLFAELQKYKEGVQAAIEAKDEVKAKALLNAWNQLLAKAAVDQNEDVDSKIAQDICITGHSLGGGCAQVGYVHYMSKEERIPLPGKKCSGYFFDDVAINTEDNTQFKEFGKENTALLNRLNSRFEIIRRQEVGDFIPRGGEEHLGATFTDAETKDLLKWLRFDAAVSERLLTSTTREISESDTVHATRFEEGKQLRTFYNAKPVTGDDYIRTYYTPKIQGIFDSHGKRGDISSKNNKRIHDYLYKKFWKLPSRFSFLFREQMRISFNRVLLFFRRLIFRKRSQQITPPHHLLDHQGNFSVRHDTGIDSKKK